MNDQNTTTNEGAELLGIIESGRLTAEDLRNVAAAATDAAEYMAARDREHYVVFTPLVGVTVRERDEEIVRIDVDFADSAERDNQPDGVTDAAFARACSFIDGIRPRAAERIEQALLPPRRDHVPYGSTPLTDAEAMREIADVLNRPGEWNGADVCDAVATIIVRTGRQILDNALDDDEDEERLAESLIGLRVRDQNGREWRVESIGEKDGWATIRGAEHWDRASLVEVLDPTASELSDDELASTIAAMEAIENPTPAEVDRLVALREERDEIREIDDDREDR